jgi:hypothetical protein
MSNVLPKGHRSCLSAAFRYTPAVHTNIANTFARIRRELTQPSEAHASAPQARIEPSPVLRSRRFPRETIETAWRLLRAGGLRPMPRLVHSSERSDG